MAYRRTNVRAGDLIEIPGGLNPGSQIIVRGRVLQHEVRFAINLKCGEEDGADIALHFNPRNDNDVVVRNSFRGGHWEREEREASRFPFNNGRKFTIRIVTLPDCYRILVNNSDFVRFNHRIPPDDVRFLELGDGAEYYEASVQNNCRVPFLGHFLGGMKQGQAVRVRGMVKDDGDRFSVNFQCDRDGKDMGLHFNPRQNQRVVVLNCRKGGDWGNEQIVTSDDFPFERQEFFDLFFIATDDKFNIYVNEHFFTSFDYRCHFRDIRFLTIRGDVELMDVDILDPLPDDFIKEIPQGLEKNDLVVVKGFFFAEGTRFQVNLIKGTSLDNDVALHFNARRDQDTLVINSKEGGSWEAEERHPLPPAMTRMVPFEVEILAKKKKYKIFANDKKICNFRARDDIESVSSINACGDAYIYEIKVLGRLDKPFTDSLPGRLEQGNWVTITGAPDDAAARFAVNLQCGPDVESDDIAFHFNPRFSEGEVVRNTREWGKWGSEERDQPCFPFEPEDRFELALVMMSHGIRVFVNHRRFIDYRDRMDRKRITHTYLSGGCDYFEPEFF